MAEAMVRWFAMPELPGLGAVANALVADEYNPESGRGFTITSVRSVSIEGAYTVRRVLEETTRDPFGSETSTERVVYESTRFTIRKDFPELEVVSPSPPLSAFFHAIAKSLNFQLTIAPLRVDLSTWLEAFEVDHQVLVNRVQVGGLQLSSDASADLVVSGVKDVRGHLSALAAGRMHELSRIRALVVGGQPSGEFEFSRTGVVTARGHEPSDLLSALRRCVPSVNIDRMFEGAR